MTREWARILLACEADAGTVSGQTEAASALVYERLRSKLCRLMGAVGFHALAARALTRSKAINPALLPVRIAADGRLLGLTEAEAKTDASRDGGAGLILIVQLLGLFLGLLGEATTLQLIEDLHLQFERESNEAGQAVAVAGAEAPAPAPAIEDLLREIDRLRSVSDRLDAMAGKHAGMETGLETVAGNIRAIATVLDIYTLIRGKSDVPGEETEDDPPARFLM